MTTSPWNNPDRFTKRRHRLPAAVLLAALAGLGALAHASDTPEAPVKENAPLAAEDSTQSSAQKSATAESAPAPATPAPGAADIFKPSEEISEDLSVPFPVDI